MTEVYDQTQNPRYLPRDAPPEPLNLSPELIHKARTELATVSDVMQSVESPGWPHLDATIRGQMELAEKRMKRAETLMELHRNQGIITACEWLLQLPEQMRREQRRLSELMSQIEAEQALET